MDTAPKKPLYKFAVNDDADFETATYFESLWDWKDTEYTRRWIAEEAAGLLAQCPDKAEIIDEDFDLTIWHDDGTLVGKFRIKVEMEPTFTAEEAP